MTLIQNKNRPIKASLLAKLQAPVIEEKPKRGRKKKFLDEDLVKKAIRGMCKQGLTQEQIANELGMSRAWLSKNFGDEIRAGRSVANALVVENMYEQALKDAPSAINAGQFILRSQLGWSDKPDQTQVNPRPNIIFNFGDLSYEERIALLEQAKARIGGPMIVDGDIIDEPAQP